MEAKRETDYPSDSAFFHHAFNDLDRRQRMSEESISALGGQMGEVRQELASVSTILNQVAEKVNAPHPFNVWAMISSIVALVVLAAGFVALTVRPLEVAVDRLEDQDVRGSNWRLEEAQRGGYRQAQIDAQKEMLQMLLKRSEPE